MINELTDKIKITTTNKKYWIKIWIYLYIIMVLPIFIIIIPLNNDSKFIILGIVTLMLSIAMGIFHSYLLSAHEVIMSSIIELKKQEDKIIVLENFIEKLQVQNNKDELVQKEIYKSQIKNLQKQ